MPTLALAGQLVHELSYRSRTRSSIELQCVSERSVLPRGQTRVTFELFARIARQRRLLAIEWMRARQQLPHDATERVHIVAEIHAAVFDLLRAGVGRRDAGDRVGPCARAAHEGLDGIGDDARDAEVD